VSSHNNARRARQDRSDSPQYFIYLKNGALRPIKVPAGEAPLAIWYRGCWRAVFRAVTDAEFFAAHPDAKFRLAVRPNKFYPDCFTFKITTRDPEVYATGDSGDWGYYRPDQGTGREWLLAECARMLTHEHRCTDAERWRATQALCHA
jgi:hypothetical protein